VASDSRIAEVAARLRALAEEHEARMREDPEYRAAQERLELEREQGEREQRAVDDARGRVRRNDRRRASGIPERALRLFDAPSALLETEALLAVRQFMAARKTFLVLAGGVGPGKTIAASWAVDEARGRLVKAMRLTRTGTYGDAAEAFWRELGEAPLLAIDDLGTEPRDDKGWAEANFAALLDERYDREAPTILTTNLTLDRFREMYLSADGGRLLDRFREVGEFYGLAGESLRGSKGEGAGARVLKLQRGGEG
jgi:DNA replication protein DnaC